MYDQSHPRCSHWRITNGRAKLIGNHQVAEGEGGDDFLKKILLTNGAEDEILEIRSMCGISRAELGR